MKVLPSTDSATSYYAHFKSLFGEDGSVMVLGIESSKIHRYPVLSAWDTLTKEINKIKGITNAISITNLYTLEKDTVQQKLKVGRIQPQIIKNQFDADSLWKNLRRLPIYTDIMINQGETATLLPLIFDSKLVNDKDRIGVVLRIVDLGNKFEKATGIKIHYSGLPYTRSVMSQMILNEFILFLCLSIAITALILSILYRNPYAVLFPILIVLIGVGWALGFMVLYGFKITLLTGIIPPIVVVIGVPNSILILNKYRLELSLLTPKLEALKKATETIGFTIFIANITTAIGFGVFCFTKSQILVEFGIIAFLGIMSTYLLSILLIPIIFSYLPNPKTLPNALRKNKILHRFLDYLIFLIQSKRKWIYFGTLILIGIGFFGLSKIKVNGYIIDDLPKNDPVYKDLKFFETYFKGVLPFEVSIDTKRKNGVRNLDLLTRIENLETLLDSYPIFTKALSINQLIKYGKQTMYNGNPKRYSLPTSEEIGFISSYLGKISKNSELTHNYLDSNHQIVRVSFRMSDIGSAKMNDLVKKLKPRVDSIFPSKNYKVAFTGSSILFFKGMNYLVTNLFQSLAWAIFLIALIMIILFRTPRMVIISLIPNLIPLILTAGIMGFSDISLKPTTILIFSIAFGLASDQTIYFLTKFRLDLKRIKLNGESPNIRDLVNQVIHETGVSMIYTAIILFFGFSIFDFSKFGGTVSLGILVSVTMLFAILSNIILLPCMILTISKSKELLKS